MVDLISKNRSKSHRAEEEDEGVVQVVGDLKVVDLMDERVKRGDEEGERKE
jgi:hypothetical protein